MIFRARLTRAARGTVAALLAVALVGIIHAELTFAEIDSLLRTITLVPTIVLEVALLVGLWRIWEVSLIVDDTGVIVRNFRGDIRVRRVEIREVIAVAGFTGCHVALQLKVGDVLHLEGLAFASRARTDQAVREINEALNMTPAEEPS